MRLGDYAKNIHTEYQIKFPNGGSWSKFKNDPTIICFNENVNYPLHTDKFFIFIEKLNALPKKEAKELLLKTDLSYHEKSEILSFN